MKKIILITILVLIIIGGIYVYIKNNPHVTTLPVDPSIACTMDALQCPDGTYVGRSGPKCEFVCPK